jgi:hypothetical protein
MRTTKRFTPAVLARFHREERGLGTHADYKPWHSVSRGDPASSGRSHLLVWRERLRNLLSDGELTTQLFAALLPQLEDSLEQLPLELDASPHPLLRYGQGSQAELLPGTLQLAAMLGIKHPRVHGDGQSEDWVATTDLAIISNAASGAKELLAVARKPLGWDLHPRQRELLSLEREYWLRRGATWLLITPKQYDIRVELTLRRTACWALTPEVNQDCRLVACTVARLNTGRSLTEVLRRVANVVGSLEVAQSALWQAVWRGELPVDLRRSWRPHLPLQHISREDFIDLNPLAARRSAWI